MWRLFIIFIFAFLLNLIWEHLHSVLYVSYQGGAMNSLLFVRCALFDASAITFVAYVCFYSPLSKGALSSSAGGMSSLLFVFVLLVFAIILEKYALATGRWVYADTMPIISLLNVGLTPVVQLALTGYVTLKIFGFFTPRPR